MSVNKGQKIFKNLPVKSFFPEIYGGPLSEVKQCLVFSPRTSGADLLLTQLILERPRYFQRIMKVSL